MSVSSFVSRPRLKRLRVVFGAVASVLAISASAQAAVFAWTNSAGGTYSIATNWTLGGPPGTLDTARFNLGNPYVVSFTANQTVSVLDVIGGIPQFAASGAAHTYTVTSANIHGGDLLLNGSAFALDLSIANSLTINTGSEIIISSGNDAHVGGLSLGTVSGGGTGTAIVDGTGSSLTVTGSTILGLSGATGNLTFQNNALGTLSSIGVADSGVAGTSGTLLIQNGADVTSNGNLGIGTGGAAGQSGSFTVTGAGSSFTQNGSGTLSLGASANSPGTLTVGSGATFTTSTGSFTVGPTGVLNINGTLNLNGDLLVSGTVSRQGGTVNMANLTDITVFTGGHFNMTSATLTAPSNNVISVFGSASLGGTGSIITINNGSQLAVGGGASLNAPAGLNVGLSGTAFASITDTGTFLSGGPIQIGNNGGTGTLTLSNAAVGTGTTINVGENGNNSNGTFTINTGAHFGGQNITVASSGHVGAVGVVNVQDSGSQLWPSLLGTASIILGADSGSSGTINVTANATLNMGTLHGACVSVGTGSGNFTLNPTGTLNINGGRAQIGNMIDNGGNVVFSSGALGFGGDLLVGAGGLLGTNLTLASNRVLAVSGVTTINPGSTLTLSGGEFGTSSFLVNGALVFNSGTLGLCGPNGFDVGPFELFGQNFTLGSGKAIFVGEGTSVESDSTLTIDGGDFSTQSLTNSGSLNLVSGSFDIPFGAFTNNAAGRFFIERNQTALLKGPVNNAGRIEFGGGNARILGSDVFTNTGTLIGGGEVALNLTNAASGELRAEAAQRLLISGTNGTNAGVINAFGGTVEFSKALASSGQINLTGGTLRVGGAFTNSGIISGRGIITADAGLTNDGQVQLSAGLTDVFGSITGNAASKIIVSGGGTATFYNNVTMNSGSEFRVSTASTAVFFGNVAGSNFFTGSGIKDFEGGSSTLGAVSTSGSTIAQAPASISASFFRENSLSVAGHVTIDSSGGTSHLNSLNIDSGGVLDLKNNSLVLEAGDLQAITSQIRSGLNVGTGIVSTAPGSPFRLGSMSNNNGVGGAIYSSFQGIDGLSGDEVLIRYTRIGDLNLDGTVTISDFLDLASHFNTVGGATWQMGDVNYDGSVTISDFIDLASNFGQGVSGEVTATSNVDGAPVANFATDNGVSAVPEPSWMSMLGAAGTIFLARRGKLPLARLAETGVP